MPLKCPEARRRYHAKYKAENADRLRSYRRVRRQKLRAAIREHVLKVKENSSCEVCGEAEPVCLDFHHRNPTEKSFVIGEAVLSLVSIKTLQKEIDKCAVLCANCHRKVHAGLV